MKDFIVIIATIILGVFLAIILLNLKDKATGMETKVNGALGTLDGMLKTS